MSQFSSIIMSRVSNNENKINYFINNLPEAIVNNIYMNYIKPELICAELNLILKSVDSMQLNNEPLEKFLEKYVLNNEIVVKYLIKNDKIFKQIYKTHFIDDNIIFIKMTNVSSLAMCWLMYLYH